MVYYKSEIDVFENVYSIDKIVLQFLFSWEHEQQSFLNSLQAFYDRHDEIKMVHYSSFKVGTFREQFTFTCGLSSFWLGVGLNVAKTVDCKARCEFNPNKVGNTFVLRSILNLLHTYSKLCQVHQYDLAVDMPVSRELVYMTKDRRKYEEVRYSEKDKTQYLGQRNSSGRVKLYNKAIEQKLEIPLTRFEITLDGHITDPVVISMLCPDLTVLDDFQLSFDTVKLTDTDLFIFRTLLDSPDRITELSYYKKKKFLQLLKQYTRTFSIDLKCCSKIVACLNDFCKSFDMNQFVVNPFDGSLVLCDFSESI